MLIDTHIHVGQFYNNYISPLDVYNLVDQLDIDYFAVSSTSICEHKYQKALDEIRQLIDIGRQKVLPVLWLTPKILIDDKEDIFIDTEIKWRCLKIHPELNPGFWQKERAAMDYVVDLAVEHHLPIMIHTGLKGECNAYSFRDIIERHHQQIFILAHGRPINEAINLSKEYGNVYADSAFMPIPDMKMFVDAGQSQKLLWGTDMCIPKHFYPNVNLLEYYETKLREFKEICSLEQFEQVTYKNAEILFNINEM